MPDFGTWHPNVQETREAIIDRMAIEVNGRMYTETPTAGMNMYVDTALEVGGTNSGNNRPGHVALVRSDTKDKRANNNASNTALDNDKGRFASGWSFQDYHRTGDYWHHYDGVAICATCAAAPTWWPASMATTPWRASTGEAPIRPS